MSKRRPAPKKLTAADAIAAQLTTEAAIKDRRTAAQLAELKNQVKV